MHFIVRRDDQYLYHRRNNGRLYESRATTGPDAGQARVFTRVSAATKAAKEVDWGRDEVRPVKLEEMSDD